MSMDGMELLQKAFSSKQHEQLLTFTKLTQKDIKLGIKLLSKEE